MLTKITTTVAGSIVSERTGLALAGFTDENNHAFAVGIALLHYGWDHHRSEAISALYSESEEV